jgi:hypothetical protein
MENEKSIARVSEVKLPKFVEQAYDSIEGMKQFANMLLESKLVPDSYYEKGVDNKPDYTKGKTSAVVIVLLQAQQLAVPPMTGLQHIVPVNGLLSIKGDLAKTMIFASGKLKKDSWKETSTGSIEEENMVVSITATREDNGITTTRTFSVDKAKRMGLWIPSTQINGADGWKYKKSAWYKTPDRMLYYRCLGNLARDLFSDVLLNMYTTEEAVDIQRETTETIETESGAKITIPDKEHSKGRSDKMTSRVADKIPDNKFGAVKNENIQEAEIVKDNLANGFEDPLRDAIEKSGKDPKEVLQAMGNAIEEINKSPFIPSKGSVEYLDGKEVKREEEPVKEGQYTLKEMEEMPTEKLLAMVSVSTDMMEACEIIGGKNTNKKLRTILDAHQRGKLTELVAPYMGKEDGGQETSNPEEIKAGEIAPNKSFDKAKEDAKIDAFLSREPVKPKDELSGNKYHIVIEPETPRDFSVQKTLYNKMIGIEPQITSPRYLVLGEKLGLLASYPDKEIFCKMASVSQINDLLNSN